MKHHYTYQMMARTLVVCAIVAFVSSCKIDSSKPLMGTYAKAETIHKDDESAASIKQDTIIDGEGLEIVVSPKNLQEQILKRLAYTASYNKDTRNPNWVAWHLTAEHTNGEYKRGKMRFAEDEDVPEPRATNMDYVQSGYDRGHMMPSGDCRWSEQAQRESFLYTNCCPQLHNLNAGDWNELEASCRKWAEKYGEVWIAAGPVYLNKNHKTIGKNKVVVPEAFFKVVLTKDNGKYKSIGFVYRNETANKHKSEYANTVDYVERLTGYDFFSALPDDIENEIEAVANLEEW